MGVSIIAATAFFVVNQGPRVVALPTLDLLSTEATFDSRMGIVIAPGFVHGLFFGVHVLFLSPRVADRSAPHDYITTRRVSP